MRLITSLVGTASLLVWPLLAAKTPVPLEAPAWFELDSGRYVARNASGHLVLDRGVARLRTPNARAIEMTWPGSTVANPSGVLIPGARTDVFKGRNPDEWKTDIAHWREVRYVGLYQGVDLVFYAGGRNLEYDFVVAPGADPSQIRIAFSGVNGKPSLDSDGNLLLRSGAETIRHLKPFLYQRSGRVVQTVAGAYAIGKNGEIRFQVGEYDRDQPLIIDPVLTYSAYVGGTKSDVITGTAIDRDGKQWVTGATFSDVAIPAGVVPIQAARSGASDAFLAQISMDAENKPYLSYYAFLGGTGDEEASAIAIDPSGNIYITGMTNSFNYPLAGNAHQITLGGNFDAFLARFNVRESGPASLSYSTYFGKETREFTTSLAVDATGVVIAGYTDAGTLNGATEGQVVQASNRGGFDGWFARYTPDAAPGQTLRYATFFGGNGTDQINGIAIDATGRIVLGGFTSSTDLPLAGAPLQTGLAGRGSAFVAIIDTARTGLDGLAYATYFGGDYTNSAEALALDESGRIWMTGYTISGNLPITSNAYQSGKNVGTDAFVTCLDLSKPLQEQVAFSTYLGGQGADVAYGLALQPGGKLTISGYTTSADFPEKDSPLKRQPQFGADAFVASFDTTKAGAETLTYSVVYGGSGMDYATGVAVDATGNVSVAGVAGSSNLIVTDGKPKPNMQGIRSSFVLRLGPQPLVP